MPDSERITWEPCPACGEPAAVGWLDGRPVEFDCPDGCIVNADQLDLSGALPAGRSAPPG